MFAPTHIFRAYDIRGIVDKDLTEQIFEKIGYSVSQILKTDIFIANDMRESSERFKRAFINGYIKSGFSVTDIGLLPIGIAGFWSRNKRPLAYVTASHLDGKYNGIKFYHKDGRPFSYDENVRIKDVFFSISMPADERGRTEKQDPEMIIENYKKHMLSKIKKGSLNVLIDCMNGTAVKAKDIFTQAGFRVDLVRNELKTPEGEIDPNKDELCELKSKIDNYDVGIAFDGDADRMILLDETGKRLRPEEVSYIILSELLKKDDGPIISNVECSSVMDYVAEKFGRRLIRVPVGYTFVEQAVRENNACFGVEKSSHYSIPFMETSNDAIAAALYALHAISLSGKKLSELVSGLPKYVTKQIDIKSDEEKKFLVIDKLKAKYEGENVNTIDGIRIDFQDSWVLIRASNTSPIIRITIEAKNEQKLKELEERFYKEVKQLI